MTNCKRNYAGNGNNRETQFKKKRIVLEYYTCHQKKKHTKRNTRLYIKIKMAKTKRQFDKKLVSGRNTII